MGGGEDVRLPGAEDSAVGQDAEAAGWDAGAAGRDAGAAGRDAGAAAAQIDWVALRAAARAARVCAYAPYSRFPVGAAALVDDGRIVTGCNVENASFGLTLCAECGLVSELARTGGGRLVAFTCTDAQDAVLMPCGRCRQLLAEFAAPTLLIDTPAGPAPFAAILPLAFGPAAVFAVFQGTPSPCAIRDTGR